MQKSEDRLRLNSPPATLTVRFRLSRGGSRLGRSDPKIRLWMQKGGIGPLFIVAAPRPATASATSPWTIPRSRSEDISKPHLVPQVGAICVTEAKGAILDRPWWLHSVAMQALSDVAKESSRRPWQFLGLPSRTLQQPGAYLM